MPSVSTNLRIDFGTDPKAFYVYHFITLTSRSSLSVFRFVILLFNDPHVLRNTTYSKILRVEAYLLVFIFFLYLHCPWRSNYQVGECCDPIIWFNPPTLLCLSPERIWISNSVMLFFWCSMIWCESWMFVLMILVELLIIAV